MRHHLILLLLLTLLPATLARADAGPMILAKSREALARLQGHSSLVAPLLAQARGVLVFPDLVKLGFTVSGQFGEGVLLVADQPAAYYVTAGRSFGPQLEAAYKSEVILFLTDEALNGFRASRGWEVGLDAPVPVLHFGAGAPVTEAALQVPAVADPVVGFIFSDEGLIADLTMNGSRIVRIAR